MPIQKAEELAQQMLEEIELSSIALYREPQCSDRELFYVMFIRALMSKEQTIIIESPHTLLNDLNEMQKIFNSMSLLNREKTVLILDIINNRIYYEGCLCNITE